MEGAFHEENHCVFNISDAYSVFECLWYASKIPVKL